MSADPPLTPADIAKLRWANSHPQVKIDDFDTVGDDLHSRGYLDHYDAGYIDWYGYWVTISPKGYKALLIAESGTAQGTAARSDETEGLSPQGNGPVVEDHAPKGS